MKTLLGARTFALATMTLMTAAALWAADTRRAPPPKFDSSTVNDIFFPDARKVLGPGGPPVPGQPVAGPGAPAGPGGPSAPSDDGATDGNKWSSLVSAESLEGEIKSQPGQIDAALKAGDPRKAVRMVMTSIAAIYGVIYRYDTDVRWKADSHGLRDSFARAGNNLKAWTDSQKKEVAKLKTDLSDLIQGNTPAVTPKFDGEAPWNEIADRPPLMHRLEQGQGERMNVWSKDAATLKANAEGFVREAELIAMIGKIIQDKSYEFADDATYIGFAKDLESQARAAVDAAKKGDAAAAGSAVSKMQKACDDCHGGYR